MKEGNPTAGIENSLSARPSVQLPSVVDLSGGREAWSRVVEASVNPKLFKKPNMDQVRAISREVVAACSVGFESRWTYGSLEWEDKDLHARFMSAREDWYSALNGSDLPLLVEETHMMMRAYDSISLFMEKHGSYETAYWFAKHPTKPIEIAIGPPVPLVPKKGCVYLTMQEVVVLLADTAGFAEVAKIKTLFPGAIVAPADTVEGFSDLGVTLEETWS